MRARPYPSFLGSILIILIMNVVLAACYPLTALRSRLGPGSFMLVMYSLGMGLTFAVVDRLRRRKEGVSSYNFRIGSWKVGAAIVVCALGLLFGVAAPLQRLIPNPELTLRELREQFGQTGVAAFLCIVVVGPVLEELIFRGVMLDGLMRRYDPFNAVLVSSFLFGFAHLNAFQLIGGLVFGCFLGWVYCHTRSVGCCILGHMAINGTAFLLNSLNPPPTKFVHVRQPGWSSYVVLFAVSAPFIFGSVFILSREFKKERCRRAAFSPDETPQADSEPLPDQFPDQSSSRARPARELL